MDRYLELDYAAELSRYSEADDKFGPKLAALNELFADDIKLASAISRPRNLSAADLAEQKRAHFGNVSKRKLFGIDDYVEPRFGHVFACHLSDPWANASDIRSNVFYLAKIEGDLKIVSWDGICSECQGAGYFGNRPCPRCNGAKWLHMDGATLALGELVKSRLPQ